ncbi:hypothetical protein GE09DRAFT_1106285 [Coniochaeta sp. 2T2.1]|nr:hypothetical protein GE09DRAFT_1106285 [Coniochaeta sp. 2T2.1]
MDQLADQASDLRSFLNNPVSAGSSPAVGVGYSPSPGAAPVNPLHRGGHSRLPPPSQPSPGSAYGDNSAHQQQHQQQLDSSRGETNNKRKSEDEQDGSKPHRSKRNRYISIACNECKRRKIKCNGLTPCQRCGNLQLQCLYTPNCCTTNFKDTDDFKQVTDQVARLQEQYDALKREMNAWRQETLRLAPIQERSLPLPGSHAVTPSPSTSSIRSLPKPTFPAPRIKPSFNGPTSINFTVDMAKNTLHNMGYSTAGEGQDEAGGLAEDSPMPSPTLNPIVGPPHTPAVGPRDPLWDFDKNEMVRLCRVHEEEVGIMYPVIQIGSVIEHAKFLATWMESAKRNGMVPPHGQDHGISDMNTCILKIVMCCGLVVEEHGHSDKATLLFESIGPIVDRKLMSEPVDVNNLPFLALVAGYRFLSNDEILAWRIIGQVCRLCLELGLHRREGLEKIADDNARRNALMAFWSAYVLDRRWSFGTGLPYVCDDDKIDPKLPMPDSHPYLVAMITYSRLGAKIWRLVDYFEPAVVRELQRKDFDQLDNEILDWYKTVPEEIKVASLSRIVPMPSGPAYNTERLQIWTRLRLNQIRIWLHTPVLHSASSIAENMPLAQRAVDLAKETIRYMAHMNNTSNLYRKNQVFYHQFLTSAIAVLFLASTHAPLQFSSQCRTEFYMALELVKDMSARSWVSQRLWRTVGSLKAYARRLGLSEDDGDQQQQQRSGAAMAMAGLASGGMGSMSAGSSGPQTPMPMLPAPVSRPSSGSIGRPGMQQQHQFNAPPGHYVQAGQLPAAVPPVLQQQQQGRQAQAAAGGGDDKKNGLRLKDEMTAIFEGYTGLNGRRRTAPGPLTQLHPAARVQSGGGSRVVSPREGMDGAEGVYHVVRDLF